MSAISAFNQLLDFLRNRKRDYQHALITPAGARVLIDLAKFCRANETCFHTDARLHAVLEGRREVWLRIQQHLHLTPEQLAAIYSGNQVALLKDTDDEPQ
jgi:hypothetical protein